MKDALLSGLVIAMCSALVLIWNSLTSPDEKPVVAAKPAITRNIGSDQPILPIPRPTGLDPLRVDLGRRLFHDPGLSGDGTISCSSCHDLAAGGDDGRKRSVGIQGRVGAVNTPSVYNTSLSFRQFWDGRATSLEEQVEGPILNPVEMGGNWDDILAFLLADESYAAAFAAAYPEGVTRESVTDAIATFERSLLTPDSPFDRYLRGETDAMSAEAVRGYALFDSYGCTGCHQGAAMGANMFQRLGVMRDYFADRGNVEQADLGRFNVTGREEDKHVFKVPSLRNVALTAPYFHDGSAASLEAAVRVMSRYQLGRSIEGDELRAIVAFLESLTGIIPEAS